MRVPMYHEDDAIVSGCLLRIVDIGDGRYPSMTKSDEKPRLMIGLWGLRKFRRLAPARDMVATIRCIHPCINKAFER